MPWSKTDPAKERVKFILEWEKRWDAGESVMNLSELCREFGISRETVTAGAGGPDASQDGRHVRAGPLGTRVAVRA